MIEDILKSKKPHGRLIYQVKWEGFDKDLTWYNADSGEFDNAQNIVDNFHRRHP